MGSAPLWAKILMIMLKPFRALSWVIDNFFPVTNVKKFTDETLGIVKFISMPRWPGLIAGIVLQLGVMWAWYYNLIYRQNYESDLANALMFLMTGLLWATPLVVLWRTTCGLWARLFGSSVLIGSSEETEAYLLADKMKDEADRRNIKLTFVGVNGIVRAYFRNDDEAALVRLTI